MNRIFAITFCLILGLSISSFSQTEKKPVIRKELISTAQKGNALPAGKIVSKEKWVCLGPSGMPNNITGSNTYGVGQVNRIEFDPLYDGKKNQTVYACSFFGGLWRSENDGTNWQNVNTDFLPSTSVADVCINPFDRNEIFICTGYGDGGIYDVRSANWAHINPIWTTGIFRSKDYGKTWVDISGDFLDSFKDGGMCRAMVINPFNPDQIFVATTNGVFRTNNASADNVIWKNVFDKIEIDKRDIRGIALKPDDSNTIYASGKDIFVSKDGGNSWQELTGEKYNLDIYHIKDSLEVRRINIAVTPANPNRLYAYILGTHQIKSKTVYGAHIAIFENDKWEIIETRFSSGRTYFADTWMAIAVSPVDANAVYYANTRLIGSENIDSIAFDIRSPYCGQGFHADVHDLAFQPNVVNPKLFCGNHGGMSVKTFPNANSNGWEYKNEGLEISTIWSFDDSPANKDVAIIATQDNGTLIRYDTLGNMWHFIYGGDGYTARIDDRNPSYLYFSSGDKSLNKFKLKAWKSDNEISKIPHDPQVKADLIITPKTFPMENDPTTQEPWFGFTEIFSKKIDNPTIHNKSEEVWIRQSDLYKTEQQGWKRQITEMAFCKEKPEFIYVVTGGQQNDPWSEWHLPSMLFKSEKGGLNGMEKKEIYFKPMEYPGQFYDNDTLPIITGIAVSPVNPNNIWISYTGIPDEYRVWVSSNGGKSWMNADPNGVFKNNPVNAIVYLDGSADRLYVGTDRGLYTKSRFTDWQKVKDFPSVRVTELKINYAFKKLRVATFGRGLWEGPVEN